MQDKPIMNKQMWTLMGWPISHHVCGWNLSLLLVFRLEYSLFQQHTEGSLYPSSDTSASRKGEHTAAMSRVFLHIMAILQSITWNREKRLCKGEAATIIAVVFEAHILFGKKHTLLIEQPRTVRRWQPQTVIPRLEGLHAIHYLSVFTG